MGASLVDVLVGVTGVVAVDGLSIEDGEGELIGKDTDADNIPESSVGAARVAELSALVMVMPDMELEKAGTDDGSGKPMLSRS